MTTETTTAVPRSRAAAGGHRAAAAATPSLVRITQARALLEIKQFFASKGQMILSFATPVVMLLLFSLIFGGKVKGTDVQASQLYATGMLGVGIVATSFQSLALQVGLERRNGALKRLRGTPMPPVAYFLGKVAMVLVSSLGQAVVMLGIGAAFFHLSLPSSPSHWLTFAWLYLLGITACSLLGLAFSNLLTAEDGGGPIVVLPFMIMQFISGVFIPFQQLPHYLQQFAALLPLKWLCQGMRSVFLPDSYASIEVAHSWELGRTALILGLWCVGALLLCLKSFRWKGKHDG